MGDALRSLRIVGLHPVIPSDEQFHEAVGIMYGEDLGDEERAAAEAQVREHFANLYLLEMQVEPPGAEIDWAEITQPVDGQPRDSWQVAYDDNPLDEDESRWTFFFHYLDRSRPLNSELGPLPLPEPTPIPPHLSAVVYDVPG